MINDFVNICQFIPPLRCSGFVSYSLFILLLIPERHLSLGVIGAAEMPCARWHGKRFNLAYTPGFHLGSWKVLFLLNTKVLTPKNRGIPVWMWKHSVFISLPFKHAFDLLTFHSMPENSTLQAGCQRDDIISLAFWGNFGKSQVCFHCRMCWIAPEYSFQE